jgi:tripartite-type tricarboxylate transporter receptor subunit TctC
MMELFQRKASIRLSHVPYKGTPQAVQAVLTGEVGVMNIGIGLVRAHIASGKLIALAKTGFPSPDALPGVPALTSAYPDAEFVPWLAVFGPKGMPRAIVEKLNSRVGKALSASEVKGRLAELDLAPAPSTPIELDKQLRADIALNRELVKSIGLRLE